MKNFHKNLNIAFIGGILGAVIMTLVGPRIIGALVTPPVSFGVNCEPATVYSMQKLILGQIIGLVVGVLLAFLIRYKVFADKTQPPVGNNV